MANRSATMWVDGVGLSLPELLSAIAAFCAAPPAGINGGNPITNDTQWSTAVSQLVSVTARNTIKTNVDGVVTATGGAALTLAQLQTQVNTLAQAVSALAAQEIRTARLVAAFFDKAFEVGQLPSP